MILARGGGLPPYIVSCRRCGALCLAVVELGGAGRRRLWDPDLFDRRMIRSYLTARDVASQGFGHEFGGVHRCPATIRGGRP